MLLISDNCEPLLHALGLTLNGEHYRSMRVTLTSCRDLALGHHVHVVREHVVDGEVTYTKHDYKMQFHSHRFKVDFDKAMLAALGLTGDTVTHLSLTIKHGELALLTVTRNVDTNALDPLVKALETVAPYLELQQP